MSITPESFKHLADELSKNIQSEAHLRTAISRYYYAAFHFVKDQLYQLFDDRPKRFKKYIQEDLTHGPLQDILGAVNDPNSQQLSRTLDSFHKIRKKADYRLRETVTSNNVQFSLSFYKLVLQCWGKIDRKIVKSEAGAKIDLRIKGSY